LRRRPVANESGHPVPVRRLLVTSLSAAIVASVPAAAQQPAALQRVAWLQGCWESVSPQRLIQEQWTAPRGGTMLGVGRTIRGEQTVDYDFVVVREQNGRLAYEAHPAGQAPAVFLSKEIGDSMVVFENPEHDFPQRVGYRRDGTGLKAWVEGSSGGQPRRVDFDYRAAACPVS
jgi:hypothetical protein